MRAARFLLVLVLAVTGVSSLSDDALGGEVHDDVGGKGHTRRGSGIRGEDWEGGGGGGEGGGANRSGRRNLVLGLDFNLKEWELRVFLASLRSTGCVADVVIFIGGDVTTDKAFLAERHAATFVSYDHASLSLLHGPTGVHRFHLYREFLGARRHEYGMVLHTDVRDVMFQDDPFERIDAHGGGVFFLESSHLVIGTSNTNRLWMMFNCTPYLAENVLAQVGHNPRSCSGNMFGTSDAVYAYSKLMEEEQVFLPIS